MTLPNLTTEELKETVKKRIELLAEITQKEFEKGNATINQEWFLVFQVLQDLYKKIEANKKRRSE